jgi:hypothetical protein
MPHNPRKHIMKPPSLFLATALSAPMLAPLPLVADALTLTPLSTVSIGDPADLFDAAAAEIVKFDPVTKRMFVVNGSTDSIDIFDASNPSSPETNKRPDLPQGGPAFSVSPPRCAQATDEAFSRSSVVRSARTPARRILAMMNRWNHCEWTMLLVISGNVLNLKIGILRDQGC